MSFKIESKIKTFADQQKLRICLRQTCKARKAKQGKQSKFTRFRETGEARPAGSKESVRKCQLDHKKAMTVARTTWASPGSSRTSAR